MRFLLLALAAFCLFASGCGNPKVTESINPCSQGYSYTAPDGTYSFCVPKDWSMQTQNDFGRDWFAYSPAEGAGDTFYENMNLGRLDGHGMTLEAAAERQKESVQSADSFQDLGTASSKLGLQDARTLHYTFKLGGQEMESRQTVAIANDRVYVVTYSAQVGHDPWLPQVQASLESFRFLA